MSLAFYCSHMCPTFRAVQCSLCELGHAPNSDLTGCVGCSAGSYAGPGFAECLLAPPGTYTPALASAPIPCNAGYFSEGGSDTCTSCLRGTFSPVKGGSMCSLCLSGSFSLDLAVECTKCPPGQVSDDGAESCFAECPSGTYRIGSSCHDCIAGQYAEAGWLVCLLCKSGTISENKAGSCEACSAGTIAEGSGSTACVDCGAGKSSKSEASSCTSCSAGYFSGPAASTCTPCTTGKQAEPDSASCAVCQAGRYSLEEARVCQFCPSGKYSEEQAGSCVDCSGGQYSEIGSSKCESCGKGEFSPPIAASCQLCSSGTFSSVESAACQNCLDGSYSSAGSESCESCVSGRYSGASAAMCQFCPAGKRSSDTYSECIDCSGGTYSFVGTDKCTECAAGRYSGDVSSQCLICEAGKFGLEKQADSCTTCGGGKSAGAAASSCDDCEEAFYAGPGSPSCYLCAGGSVPTTDQSACEECPAGKKGELGTTECVGCASGTFAFGNSPICTLCDAGTKCGVESSDMEACPPGSYSGSGSSACDACGPVEIAPDERSASCASCLVDQIANDDRTICTCDFAKGFIDVYSFVNGTSALRCTCPPGHFYEFGQCSVCASGTYKSYIGHEPCDFCQLEVLGSFSTTSSIAALGVENYDQLKAIPPPISKYNCTCGRNEFFLPEAPPEKPLYIGQCVDCPSESTVCGYAGIHLHTLPLAIGWWRSDIDSWNFEQCITYDACPQAKKYVNSSMVLTKTLDLTAFNASQCLTGHHGPLCNLCDDGYVMGVTGVCDFCELTSMRSGNYIALIGGLIGCAVAVFIARRIWLKFVDTAVDQLRGIGTVSSVGEEGSDAKMDKLALVRQHHKQYRNKHWIYRAKTQAKILVSCFQIVSQFEFVLNIRFPRVFEKFMRWAASVANLNLISLVPVGCVVETNFYTTLTFYTLTPIFIAVLILLVYSVRARCLASENRRVFRDECMGVFLGLTFCVLVGVSTTIFKTFQCMTYGDDPVSYLIVDQSIDCGDASHRRYMVYAAGMGLVYPVGIPALYTWLLFSNRKALLAEEREDDHSLHKIGFLWDSYVKDCWWFEIFECLRRLSLTGVLAFVAPGSPSQIVFAILLALVSIAMYTHRKPFEREQDDALAIVSQWSIFFTLFAALLRKMKVDQDDNYNQNLFGVLLIGVNLMGVTLVALKLFVKPFKKLTKKLGEKHLHQAALKGVGIEHEEWEKFEEYFVQLVESEEFMAAWEPIRGKEWASQHWLEETGAVGEWRCGDGDGPRDQGRVVFEVDHGIEEVYAFLIMFGRGGTTLACHPMVDYGEGVLDVYLAAGMPWPLRARDFLVKRRAWLRGDKAMILARSIKDDDAGLKRSALQGRVRAWSHINGHWLETVGENRTRVVHVVSADLKGTMTLDSINKRALSLRLHCIVDELRKLGKTEEDEEAGRGSMLKKGRKLLWTISSGAAELGGGVVSKFERRKKEDTRSRPSIVPPPPPGAPPPNNNVLLRVTKKQAVGIELLINPMHRGAAEKVKEAKDTRHLDRALSGGYKARGAGMKTKVPSGPAKKRGERVAVKEAAAATVAAAPATEEVLTPPVPPALPVSEEEGIAHVDPDSGDPYWENSKTRETQWEEPNK